MPKANDKVKEQEKPLPQKRLSLAATRDYIIDKLVRLFAIALYGFPVFVLVSPLVYVPLYRSSLRAVEFTVDSKERVTTGSGDSMQSYYLVWSREGEVFCVTDTYSFFTFDSSDRYGKLAEGSSVKAKVAGWRIPFLSWYRNIVVIDEVNADLN